MIKHMWKNILMVKEIDMSIITKGKEFVSTIPFNKIGNKDLLDFEKTPRNMLIAGATVLFLVLFLIHGHHAYAVILLEIGHPVTMIVYEVILVMVVPLILILKDMGKSHVLLFWVSLSGMIGIMFMRYNLVHDTQLKPLQMMKKH